MQHSDALRVAMLMAGAPDVGPLPPARPLPAFSRAAAAVRTIGQPVICAVQPAWAKRPRARFPAGPQVDEIGRMLSTLHASSPAISVTLESEQHVM